MSSGRHVVLILVVHPDPGVATALRECTDGSPCHIEVVHCADPAALATCESCDYDLVIVGGDRFEEAIALVRRRDPIVPLVLLINERDVEKIAWRHGIDMFVREPVLVPDRWKSIVVDAILRRSIPRQSTEILGSEWDDAMVRVQAVRNRRQRLAELNQATDALSRAISDRDEATRRLEEIAVNYRAIFDAPTVAKIVVDPLSLRVIDCNHAASALFGCDESGACFRSNDCIARCLGNPDDESNPFVALIRRGISSGHEIAEHVMQTASGKRFLAELSLARVVFSGDTRVIVQIRDIEHRRRNQAMAALAVSKYHTLFDVCPNPIIESDLSGFIVALNPAAEELLNIRSAEALHLRAQDILGDQADEAIKSLSAGGTKRAIVMSSLFGKVSEWRAATVDDQSIVFVATD